MLALFEIVLKAKYSFSLAEIMKDTSAQPSLKKLIENFDEMSKEKSSKSPVFVVWEMKDFQISSFQKRNKHQPSDMTVSTNSKKVLQKKCHECYDV